MPTRRPPMPLPPASPGQKATRQDLPWRQAIYWLGAIAAIADLLQYFGPVLSWAIAGAAALLLFSAAVYFLDRNAHRLIGLSFATSAIIVPGLIGLKVWQSHVPGALDRGIIGSQLPAIRSLQDGLKGITDGQAEIRTGLGRVDDRTARMEQRLQQTKLETSGDPRKELANLGVTWTHTSFREALKSGDVSVVKLFLDGGLDWTKADGSQLSDRLLLSLARTTPEVLALLYSQPRRMSDVVCPIFEKLLRDDDCDDANLGNLTRILQKLPPQHVREICGSTIQRLGKKCHAEIKDLLDHHQRLRKQATNRHAKEIYVANYFALKRLNKKWQGLMAAIDRQ